MTSLITPPFRPDDLDISMELVHELVLRRTLLDETTSIRKLALNLGLAPMIIEAVFETLRGRKYLDVHGLSGTDYSFSLTETGRQQAQDRFQQSRYSGVAPVSLRQYWEVVLAQRPTTHIDRDVMERAMADLVINDQTLDLMGPALVSNSSVLMYGPSGTGKTSIAERLIRVYDDFALIPYAVEADGQIVTVFDPAVHHPLDDQPQNLDPRWIACKRPMVTVGGEMTFDMLQLSYDRQSGVYGAPLQMKANNGILLIDDFGRQTVEPEALLNRWIIPLDRRLDYLALAHGVQFAIPFELMVVFSTNLDPAELGDEAFLRRISNKVYIGAVRDDDFDWILARVAQSMDIRIETGMAAYVRRLCRMMGSGGDLRPCYPRDIARLLRCVCEYEGTASIMNRHNVERAAQLYFNSPLPENEYGEMEARGVFQPGRTSPPVRSAPQMPLRRPTDIGIERDGEHRIPQMLSRNDTASENMFEQLDAGLAPRTHGHSTQPAPMRPPPRFLPGASAAPDREQLRPPPAYLPDPEPSRERELATPKQRASASPVEDFAPPPPPPPPLP